MAHYLGQHKIIFERPERGQVVRRWIGAHLQLFMSAERPEDEARIILNNLSPMYS